MIELGILIFVLVVSIVLSATVFQNNPKSATSWLFAAFGLSIAFWSTIMYLSVYPPSPDSMLFFIRLSMLAGTLLAILGLFFAANFPHDKIVIPKIILAALSVAGGVTMMIAMSDYMFTDLVISGSNAEPTPGWGIIFFMVVALGSNLASVLVLIHKYIKSTGREKKQTQYILLGIFLMFFLLITTNFLIVIVLKSSSFIVLAPLYTLTFLGSTAYAILRHRLLDLRLLIVRTVAFTFLIISFGALLSLSFILFSKLFFTFALNPLEIGIFVFLSLVFSFLFQPAKLVFEKITDRIFYRGHYDQQAVFGKLANTVTSSIEIFTLAKQSANLLTAELRVTYVTVGLKNDDAFMFVRSDQSPTNDPPLREIFEILKKVKTNPIVSEEQNDPQLKTWMDQYEISLIVKLEVKGETTGCLLFGAKSSGEIYYDNDLKILPTIADQLAIAFANALSVLKISQFNDTLKGEVSKATTELSKANQDLKALDRLKDEFLSMASHELKSPMLAIKNYLWMAIHKGKDEPERMPEFLNIAHQAADRLIAMVNDLLDVSRIDSGRVSMEVKELDLSKICKETVDIFAPQAKDKNLSLKMDILEGVHVKADDTKLREIISNLISNAIKYTSQGSVTITNSEENGMIRLNITDTGPGISEPDQQKLFQKFSRITNTNHEIDFIDGTGLGLYITKKYTELMSGHIGLTSVVGKGSTFWIELPRV